MSWPQIALWGLLPYLMLVILVGGLIWRYRYDQFGWTTRSSQLYESRLLRIGSPLFHFGLVFVIAGHVIGLVVPEWLTTRVGVSETDYHVLAYVVGGIAGFCTLVGLAILIWRRRTCGPVFRATTRNDKTMYVVLAATLAAGVWTTVIANHLHHAYDYRRTVAPWFRSIFLLHPRVDLMATVPWPYQLHTLIGMALFVLWPFTRLVHAFSAPIGYLFRP